MRNIKTLIMIILSIAIYPPAVAQNWPGTIEISEVTTNTSNTTTVNFNHTVSGENRLLIVGISLETGDESKRVSSVTYSGLNLNRAGEVRGPSNDPRVDVWLLINPPAGTGNIIISLFEDNKIATTAISLTGVNQAEPISNVITAGGSEGTPYLLVPSRANDLVIDFVASLEDEINAGPLQVEVSNLEIYDSGKRGGVSVEPGNNNVEMTWLGSEKWASVGFNINSVSTTDIEEDILTPNKIELRQNYPNPFNPATTISYSISSLSLVTLKIFNVLGKEISSLINAEQQAGVYQVEFEASELPSGVYFYRFEVVPAGLRKYNFVETRQMILMK